MLGSIDVLSIRGGHDELKFDSAVEAKKKIDELMQSRHSIMIQTEDGATHKVSGYDDQTGEYLVHSTEQQTVEHRYPAAGTPATSIMTDAGEKKVARIENNEYVVIEEKKVPVVKRFKMDIVKATALAPTAGG